MIHIEGFWQVLKGAALKGGHGAVEVGVSGHDDDRQARVFGLDLVEQIQPRAARHADVADQNLRPFVFVEGCQNIARIGKTAAGHLFAQQRFFQHEANGLVIIYDPNGLHYVVLP